MNDSEASDLSKRFQTLSEKLNQQILGQPELIESVLVAMVAGGHILLEGLPGLGKTELIKTLSALSGLEARRVQFTPDLLPGDIVGSAIIQEVDGRKVFEFSEGPVFTQLLLADEINRASPKTQAALLEAMQERSVSAMGETRPLPKPFFVFATQNPVDLEGTYALPEAQTDRFLFKLNVFKAPSDVLEAIINKRSVQTPDLPDSILDTEAVMAAMASAEEVFLAPPVVSYIARLVDATHGDGSKESAFIRFGASPRAAIGLARAARARAWISGRKHAGIEDVQALAKAVLRHRLVLNYEARLEGLSTDDLIDRILEALPTENAALPEALDAAKIQKGS
ncbi:MAG: AAA family ATPase [Opitutales bacterium]